MSGSLVLSRKVPEAGKAGEDAAENARQQSEGLRPVGGRRSAIRILGNASDSERELSTIPSQFLVPHAASMLPGWHYNHFQSASLQNSRIRHRKRANDGAQCWFV